MKNVVCPKNGVDSELHIIYKEASQAHRQRKLHEVTHIVKLGPSDFVPTSMSERIHYKLTSPWSDSILLADFLPPAEHCPCTKQQKEGIVELLSDEEKAKGENDHVILFYGEKHHKVWEEVLAPQNPGLAVVLSIGEAEVLKALCNLDVKTIAFGRNVAHVEYRGLQKVFKKRKKDFKLSSVKLSKLS